MRLGRVSIDTEGCKPLSFVAPLTHTWLTVIGGVAQVIDSSDVVMQILDIRDPIGTRCPHIEKYLKKHAAHKHLVLILNKV